MNQFRILSELIRSRRSIRRYQPRPLPADLVRELLATCMWAPSAHNRQPWRFAVVQTDAVRGRLAQMMGARLRADRTADGDPPHRIERDVARSLARLTGAPLLIVVCLSMEDMDQYPDARRQAAEQQMAVQSAAMAAQNLLLLAHAAGLGGCWICAPLFVPDLVRRTLDLPPDWQPQGLITLGWPAESKEKSRRLWTTNVTFR